MTTVSIPMSKSNTETEANSDVSINYDDNKHVIFNTVYEVGRNGAIVYSKYGDLIVIISKKGNWKKIKKMIDELDMQFPFSIYQKPNGIFIVGTHTDAFLNAVRKILYC